VRSCFVGGRQSRLWPAVAMGARLGRERVLALEDCRHVSGSFERFLTARGERVVPVPARLMANSRRSSRERRRSDRLDAIAVARAALAEGLQTLPSAELAGPQLDICDRDRDSMRDLTGVRSRPERARYRMRSPTQQE
jgi:transposase